MYIKMYKWHGLRYLQSVHVHISNNKYFYIQCTQSDSDIHDATDLRFLYTTFS